MCIQVGGDNSKTFTDITDQLDSTHLYTAYHNGNSVRSRYQYLGFVFRSRHHDGTECPRIRGCPRPRRRRARRAVGRVWFPARRHRHIRFFRALSRMRQYRRDEAEAVRWRGHGQRGTQEMANR